MREEDDGSFQEVHRGALRGNGPRRHGERRVLGALPRLRGEELQAPLPRAAARLRAAPRRDRRPRTRALELALRPLGEPGRARDRRVPRIRREEAQVLLRHLRHPSGVVGPRGPRLVRGRHRRGGRAPRPFRGVRAFPRRRPHEHDFRRLLRLGQRRHGAVRSGGGRAGRRPPVMRPRIGRIRRGLEGRREPGQDAARAGRERRPALRLSREGEPARRGHLGGGSRAALRAVPRGPRGKGRSHPGGRGLGGRESGRTEERGGAGPWK